MKAIHAALFAIVFAFVACAGTARAQTPTELPRADLFVSLGWLNGHKPDLDAYDDWYNRSLHGAATLGWYWTDHLKSEVEVAASSRADLYGNRELTIDGRRTFASSQYAFTTRRVTAGQLYQFGRNAWFHPHVGAGLDITWERTRETDQEIYALDPVSGQTRVVRRPPADPDRTDVRGRPFAAAGFKAYLSPRAFFRSDVRLVAGSRVEDVLLRVGIGVDW